jgi:hypothetical protein
MIVLTREQAATISHMLRGFGDLMEQVAERPAASPDVRRSARGVVWMIGKSLTALQAKPARLRRCHKCQ